MIDDLRRRVSDEVPFDGELRPRNRIRNGLALLVSEVRPNQRGRSLLVDFSGTGVRLDTTQTFSDESRDGTLQCTEYLDPSPQLLRAAAPTAPTVVDPAGGNWCRFSPDGTRLVHSRTNGMFATRTAGRIADSRVQVAPAGADEGRWSEDGRTIYYRNANAW